MSIYEQLLVLFIGSIPFIGGLGLALIIIME